MKRKLVMTALALICGVVATVAVAKNNEMVSVNEFGPSAYACQEERQAVRTACSSSGSMAACIAAIDALDACLN